VEGDIESLRRAGFDERTIIEALTVVSLSGWMNGYALALGLDQNDAVPLSGGNPWP
jgi:alkylhydroperoxidase family enzyme